MEASLIRSHRLRESHGHFGIPRMVGASVFTLFRTRQSPARYGKWTRTERTSIHFFRIGKSRPISAADTGRRTAITIISRQARGALRRSGSCPSAPPSLAERSEERRVGE